jgi:hypothetical protein
MLFGEYPFYDNDLVNLLKKIKEGKINFEVNE